MRRLRSAICPAFGPPEVVVVQERPAPRPDPGQARVRVRVAAVNFPDVLLVAGDYQIAVPPPFVPGSEFAGVVEEINDAGPLAVGDRVTGTALVGAFAEQIAVPIGSLNRIPDGIDDFRAAGFGVAARTAYHALSTIAEMRRDEELLVLGAGGGVGLAAVQLGVMLGASVTAVASSEAKLRVAAACGARHLINHRDGDLRGALRETRPEGVNVVVDPVGGELAEPALRSLRHGGRFVTVGYAAGIPRIALNLVLLKGIRVLGFQLRDVADIAPEAFRRNEGEVSELLARNPALPHIGATYPLVDTAAALRRIADGHAVGKILIDVSA